MFRAQIQFQHWQLSLMLKRYVIVELKRFFLLIYFTISLQHWAKLLAGPLDMDIWQARYSDPACIDRSKSNRLEKRHKRSNQVMLEVVSLSQLVLYLFKSGLKLLYLEDILKVLMSL